MFPDSFKHTVLCKLNSVWLEYFTSKLVMDIIISSRQEPYNCCICPFFPKQARQTSSNLSGCEKYIDISILSLKHEKYRVNADFHKFLNRFWEIKICTYKNTSWTFKKLYFTHKIGVFTKLYYADLWAKKGSLHKK